MDGEALDEVGFGGGDGFPFFGERGVGVVVLGLIFAGEDLEGLVADGGGEAVDGVVAGRDGFGLRSLRAAGVLGVGAVGGKLGFGDGFRLRLFEEGLGTFEEIRFVDRRRNDSGRGGRRLLTGLLVRELAGGALSFAAFVAF